MSDFGRNHFREERKRDFESGIGSAVNGLKPESRLRREKGGVRHRHRPAEQKDRQTKEVDGTGDTISVFLRKGFARSFAEASVSHVQVR